MSKAIDAITSLYEDNGAALATIEDSLTDLRREESARARFANEQHIEHDRATTDELVSLRAEVIGLKLLVSSMARHVGELVLASREQPRPETKPATRRASGGRRRGQPFKALPSRNKR